MTGKRGAGATRVELRVSPDGVVTVAVNGEPFEVGWWDAPWRREDFPRLLDLVADRFPSPLAVQVIESDGTVFRDTVTIDPAPPPPVRGSKGRERRPPRHRGDQRAEGRVVDCGGFTAGEAVAVAVVDRHAAAGPDGRVVLTVPADTAEPVEILLFGRVSGTIRVVPGTPE